MSKRDDSSSVTWLLKQGFVPEAIANYLILIGNKPPKDIFSIKEAIEWFDISKISKAPAKFDIDMLRHINKEHIGLMDDLRLSQFLEYNDSDIGKIAKLYLQEASTIAELKPKIDSIFDTKPKLDGYQKQQQAIQQAINELGIIEDFNELKKSITQKTSLKGKELFMPLRYLLTGKEHGPNLSDLYPLIKNYLMEIIK
jgi:glutamyl-tRNA synthetase